MSARRGPFRALIRRSWPMAGLALAAGAACTPQGTAQPSPATPVPTVTARVIARYPHDPGAFTQGLLVRDGRLYESTGEYGGSRIREVELATGTVKRESALPRDQFGEGMTDVGPELVSLTWQNGIAHRWRIADLKPAGTFRYTGEGWGLAYDGRHLILSDGSPDLRLLDPRTYAVVRTVPVTVDGERLPLLNELEWVDGELLANVWHDERIARIDLSTGRVKGWIDLGPLVRTTPKRNAESVPNGIAWDAKARRLYVTGKNWPTLYRIAWPVD